MDAQRKTERDGKTNGIYLTYIWLGAPSHQQYTDRITLRVWCIYGTAAGQVAERCGKMDDIQGGPAKVRPTYIFDGNIWMHWQKTGSYLQTIIINSKVNKYQQNYKQTILP